MKMIVDLPQFQSDLQKHKVENVKDCQQTKSSSQNVMKDKDKFEFQAEKKTAAAFESIICSGGSANKSWHQLDFKPQSSGSSGDQAESEGIGKILEAGATWPPVHLFNCSAHHQSDSKSTPLPGASLPQEECPAPQPDKKESPPGPPGWAGQFATSKVVNFTTSNFPNDPFTGKLLRPANCQLGTN